MKPNLFRADSLLACLSRAAAAENRRGPADDGENNAREEAECWADDLDVAWVLIWWLL